ncbi:hypothetical protein MNB_SUP05-5-767 [hydrothermal vent metagenome]|uniref:Uncharacterized protein n=1 Tax=hydrothermal vent metagenome TaxID=652676 RepID=A0A1W1BX50_9ZZZZ
MDNDAHCSDQEMTQMNVHNNTIDLCISSCFVHSVFLQSNINYYYSDLSPVNVSQLIISQYKSLTSEIITPPPTV